MVIAATLVACTTPTSQTTKKLIEYDKDTEYAIEERGDGFVLAVAYSRYQFIPESDALTAACKSSLSSIAWEIAEKRGKKILPINEQRIRLSLGRNGLTGMTLCQASVAVEWGK